MTQEWYSPEQEEYITYTMYSCWETNSHGESSGLDINVQYDKKTTILLHNMVFSQFSFFYLASYLCLCKFMLSHPTQPSLLEVTIYYLGPPTIQSLPQPPSPPLL